MNHSFVHALKTRAYPRFDVCRECFGTLVHTTTSIHLYIYNIHSTIFVCLFFFAVAKANIKRTHNDCWAFVKLRLVSVCLLDDCFLSFRIWCYAHHYNAVHIESNIQSYTCTILNFCVRSIDSLSLVWKILPRSHNNFVSSLQIPFNMHACTRCYRGVGDPNWCKMFVHHEVKAHSTHKKLSLSNWWVCVSGSYQSERRNEIDVHTNTETTPSKQSQVKALWIKLIAITYWWMFVCALCGGIHNAK